MILTYYCIITMIIIAYLLGSIPSAVWIGKKYYGIDIREHGSKNAGTTNMLRVLGRRAALPVFLLDFLKGFVAVTLTEILKYDAYINDMWLINIKIIAVFAAVLGHIFPIFAGFRGGKGVATLVGAITGIYPPVVLLCFAVWVVILMMTHYVSLASIVAGCCFPIFTIVSPKVNQSVPFIVFGSQIILKLIDRFPAIIYFGAGLLGWIAGGMIASDVFVTTRWPEQAFMMHYPLSVGCAALVILIGHFLGKAKMK